MSQATNQANIHPFPARMAPEIVIRALGNLKSNEIILDPMVGSGTVLHHAALKGHKTLGFDLDPLAILMSRVRTSKIDFKKLDGLFEKIFLELETLKLSEITLPWIDNNQETQDFIKFWFAKKQANDLRKLSFLLNKHQLQKDSIEIDALRIAFSRIIITKKVGASLA